MRKHGILKSSAICKCAFEKNIFIKNLKKHFTFENEEQFASDYKNESHQNGMSDIEYENLLKEIKEEINRRRSLGKESIKRKNIISKQYKHVHPDLLKLKPIHLSESFKSLVELASSKNVTKEILIEKMCKERAPESYSFEVFTNDYCNKIIEEIENFGKSGLPVGRPNTMNNYGIILAELGYKEDFFDPLVTDFFDPIARILYPELVGEGLDSHRTFIVSYAIGKDTDLSYHYDDAEVTINIALGKEFDGGELYLGGLKNESNWHELYYKYCHRKAYGLMHRGQQMHGAMPIDAGKRYNLIIWMRSSSVRNKLCPMCNRKPDLVLTDGEGGGFTVESVNVCSAL